MGAVLPEICGSQVLRQGCPCLFGEGSQVLAAEDFLNNSVVCLNLRFGLLYTRGIETKHV